MRLERLWLKLFHHRACRIIVQTQSVRRAAERALARPVVVQPFVADPTGYVRRAADWLPEPPAEFEFVYVASGDPHKNHANLIAAWMLLADEHHFPSLLLTIDPQREPQLAVMIATARARHRLSIEIWPWQGNGKMAEIYKKAGALIYPSTIESLGLPLIEAAAAGLPIIASERDFVRDVVDPIESFDPESPLSIARAVKRYLGIGELALPLVSARDFLKSALAEGH
jgi:glycosyltransferase involved in cell wall biosynthesis